jgi:hypothetical protein
MTMPPQTVANRLIRELFESELELDRAIARSAALLSSVAQARIDTSTAFADGQLAVMRLVQGLSSMSRARSELVRTHVELRRLGEERGDLVLPHETIKGVADLELHQSRQAA